MIIKQNRGRQWLDWQRRMVKAAQLAGVAACGWLLLALFFGEMGLPRYLAMRNHAAQLEQELAALRGETASLRKDIARLQHDPAKIERLARERLGYVRKGETVYQLAPDPLKQQEPPFKP
ncbi:FtsB family cell division protein [Nitrospira moscoviensis]|uniref:Cell division protein FtsB-like protein n=1 Tax=Nitrospira moscoviensis TaxID=42253 RepID=A0A0K2GG28_NITMO|nr:septum formation initiator family protein [Nitrospira moscoviensis]ALA59819.1 Cell division protein FtsB-like protein [Nitrospira moscoviensis]